MDRRIVPVTVAVVLGAVTAIGAAFLDWQTTALAAGVVVLLAAPALAYLVLREAPEPAQNADPTLRFLDEVARVTDDERTQSLVNSVTARLRDEDPATLSRLLGGLRQLHADAVRGVPPDARVLDALEEELSALGRLR